MERILKRAAQILRNSKRNKRNLRILTGMGAIVVFITTYALILPAVTLEKSAAKPESGIHLAAESSAELLEEEWDEGFIEDDFDETYFEDVSFDFDDEDIPDVDAFDDEGETDDLPGFDDYDEDADGQWEEDEAADIEDAEEADDAVNGDAIIIPEDENEAQDAPGAESIAEDIDGVKPAIAGTLTYDEPENDYIVEVTFDTDAGITEDVELRVTELLPETDEYKEYFALAQDEIQKDGSAEAVSSARFFDVSFVETTIDENGIVTETEIEPAASVQVKVTYRESMELREAEEAGAVHFIEHEDDDAQPVEVEVLETRTTGEECLVDAIEFQQDSFSVIGMIVKVSLRTQLAVDGENYAVTVDCTNDAMIPETAELVVSEITEDDEAYSRYFEDTKTAVAEASGWEISRAHFFDISIIDHGEEIEPESPVKVTISAELPGAEDHGVFVSHTTDDGDTVVLEGVECRLGEEEGRIETTFEAESFSVYSVSYTVDFHWDVNGETYEFGLIGGDSVSFRELVDVLHIFNADVPDDDDESEEQPDDEADADETGDFINDIVNIEFSDESLVRVVQIEEDTTAAALKEALDIETEFSEELTEEQIAEMNAKAFMAPDWVLISLKPFLSDEYLTVTMKDGEIFRIQITDAQIKKTVISASGETYEIIVTYGENAQIPTGSELKVEEITEEDDRYAEYYEKTQQAVNSNEKDGNVQEESVAESIDTAADRVDDAVYSGISRTKDYARIFDIQIWNGDEKIEPLEEVRVDINLLDAPEDNERSPKVVHFAEVGPEVMEITALEGEDNKEISFMTDEFSVYSVIYTVDFYWEVDGRMYEFSLPGGGFVSFERIVEVLGIANQDVKGENAGENAVESSENSKNDGITNTGELLNINDIELSETAKRFVADVESVKFSSPELVWVGKIDEATTVGEIKEKNRLEVRYSEELTENDIEKINGTIVEFGDWALISIRPFDTEESLAVTMKNGDQFVIRVTDAQTPSKATGLDTSGLDGKFTVNLFNYGPSSSLDKEANSVPSGGSESSVQTGINAYSLLDFMSYGTEGTGINNFTGSDKIRQGIVSDVLTGGYPTLAGSTTSLDYLFNSTSYAGGVKDVYENVSGLFYKSNVDGSSNTSGSYYSYDSDRYYAYKNANNQIDLYEQYNMKNDPAVTRDGLNNQPIGFFPFTVPDTTQTCPHPDDIHWDGSHPNGKSYGYYGSGYYDHQFGLTLSGNFMVPEGKKVDNQDMIFSFSGDDDMWVFIDDVLVLDIGGIHHPSSGMIDFTTGQVTVDNNVVGVNGNNNTINLSNGTKVTANIADIFTAAGKTWNDAEYSSHSIKVFYLERGGIYSNCKITFNIPLVLGIGEVTIVKKDADTAITDNQGFLSGAVFGIWNDSNCTGDPIATQTSGTDGKVTFSQLSVENENQRYYLKEITAPEGYVLSDEIYTLTLGEKNSNGTYSFQISDSSGNAVSTIGQEPALSVITNRKVSIKADKVWKDEINEEIDESKLSAFQVKLKLFKNGTEATSDNTTSEIEQIVSGDGTATWILKGTDTTGYTVKEIAVKAPWDADFVDVSSTNEYSGTVTGDAANGFTVTNTLPKTEIAVTKQWKDGTSANADRIFSGAKSITFTLYQKLGEAGGTAYQMDGKDVTGTVTYTPASEGADASWSTEIIQNLPKYVYQDGTWCEAVYYPVETAPEGVSITYQKNDGDASETAADAAVSSGTVTIINTDILVSIKIVKVDKNTTTRLSGAKFQLTRKLNGESSFTKFEHSSFAVEDDNKQTGPFTISSDDGIVLNDLLPGEYRIEEKVAPVGYVITLQPFTFTVDANGAVTLQEDADSQMVSLLEKAEPENIWICNEPGIALPSTGGSGTIPLTVGGFLLIAVSGLMLALRRRQRTGVSG